MNLSFCPLLDAQAHIYAEPRGRERFAAYLRVLLKASGDELALPLSAMNPLGRDHVPRLIAAYQALNTEAQAAQALVDLTAQVTSVPGTFQVGLVVVDDTQGQWTHRATAEFDHCLGEEGLWQRGWLAAHLWTSEPPSAAAAAAEVRAVVFRAAYRAEHPPAQTLREILVQEGRVRARAAVPAPPSSADGLATTARILTPYLGAVDRPTVIAALFGDTAASELGYPPLGLGPRAGLAWAQATAGRLDR